MKPQKKILIVLLCGILSVIQAGAVYQVDPVAEGVTVQGQVTLKGTIPKAEPLRVPRDSAFCGKTMPDESLLVDPLSHGIIGVVVSLEGIGRGKPVTEQVVSLVNRKCRFNPRVQATTVGSMLEITNDDPILHNTHIRKETRHGDNLINVSLPVGVEAIRKQLRRSGWYDLRCDAHTQMAGAIHVFDHPYFAVTDQNGRFELSQVPQGTYTLRLWHESRGVREQSITVPARGPITVNLELD